MFHILNKVSGNSTEVLLPNCHEAKIVGPSCWKMHNTSMESIDMFCLSILFRGVCKKTRAGCKVRHFPEFLDWPLSTECISAFYLASTQQRKSTSRRRKKQTKINYFSTTKNRQREYVYLAQLQNYYILFRMLMVAKIMTLEMQFPLRITT